MKAWTLLLALAATAAPALAHDTWFAPRAARLPGTVVLALGTGNQFPVLETPVAAQYVRERGCRQGDARVALEPVTLTSSALVLQARAPGAAALTCWAQLEPFELTLQPELIDVYLDEIDASPAVRALWATLQARGLPWRERYVKHARIELAGATEAAATAPQAAVPMGLDIVLQDQRQRLRAGQPLSFQLLRDGTPLPGQAIELRGSHGAWWLRTDADGRATVVVPSAGRWALRGTELRWSDEAPGRWDSRFINLAFEAFEAAPTH